MKTALHIPVMIPISQVMKLFSMRNFQLQMEEVKLFPQDLFLQQSCLMMIFP